MPGTTLRISTWNLEWLDADPGHGEVPRLQSDYEEMREAVASLDADVIAFQEVDGLRAAQRVFPSERWQVHIERRADPPQLVLSAPTYGQRERAPSARRRYLIDHILLGGEATQWLVSSTQMTARRWRGLSDHSPLLVELQLPSPALLPRSGPLG